jgi:hypothetical protein
MCALHGYKPDKKTRLTQQLTQAGYTPQAIQLITEFYYGGKTQ